MALPPGERMAFLDGACSDNAELRKEVEDLVKSYDTDFLEGGAIATGSELLGKSHFQAGKEIGRYHLKELIGTGGMGEVFLADDTKLNRPVAFKFLHRDVAEDPERVRRFIQEARAASALNHPNILTIHEIDSFEGANYIVSEFINGETLRERMHRGLTVAESLDVAAQVAAALQAAHEAGIVHRDIKPENIMLRRDGLVKVLDFGLAKLTEADDHPIDSSAKAPTRFQTSPGLVMGTAAYMSPEQAKGHAVDARTDLWSLGVVLHEMLTGQSPFEGETVTELITAILKTDGPTFDSDKLPQDLQSICRKALTHDKQARYQTSQELIQDLQGEKKKMEYAIQSDRFISVSSTAGQKIRSRPTLSAEYIVTGIKRHKFATFVSLAAMLFLGVGLAVYRPSAVPSDNNNAAFPVVIGEDTTEKDLKISRLATSGKVFDIAISPDGKFVAYVTGENYKGSIRVRELDTQKDVEIVPAPPDEKLWYLNKLTFTPDGSHILYRHDTPNNQEIYSVAIGGDTPVKIADKTNTASISPDGKTIAYQKEIKDQEGKWQGNDLVLANVDGSSERILVHSSSEDNSVKTDIPAWSQDGNFIACWFNFKENGQEYLKLFTVGTADGSTQPFSDQKWKDISQATWMPDGSLVVAAQEYPSKDLAPAQLWRVTQTSARAITNDPAGYNRLSGTIDGSILITTQATVRRDLWVMNGTDAITARQITFSGELSRAGFGGFSPLSTSRIVISSTISNNIDLWSMNLDGSGRKQLTSGQGTNIEPHATRDGRFIIFNSDRDGSNLHVFRMDADGGNVKQLTEKDDSKCIGISPDEKWVYYLVAENKGRFIYKVPIDGGPSSLVAKVSINGGAYDILPSDGRIAEILFNGQLKANEINIYSSNGTKLKSIPLPPTIVGATVRWTPDGKAVGFHDFRDKAANLWIIPVDGNSSMKPLTNFTAPITAGFGWSTDGKQLFVVRISGTKDAMMITNIKQ